MSELLFPVAAVAVTFLVAVPVLTLVSRGALALRRRRLRTLGDFGSASTFAWLVVPTLVPLLWLTSSALHQSEPLRVVEACLVDHAQAASCLDALLLLVALIGGTGLTIWLRARRERLLGPLSYVADDSAAARRIVRLAASDGALRKLKVRVAKNAPAPVFTVGHLRPRVIIDACFVDDADQAMLRAALLHELAHVSAFDTLRKFAVRLCLFVNPASAWLARDAEQWRAAREVQCDSEAVHKGGEPLALAEGLVRAARFRCSGRGLCGAALFCGHRLSILKLRLALLLAGPPRPARSLGHVALGLAATMVLIMPHLESVGLLDHFHFEVERLFHPNA